MAKSSVSARRLSRKNISDLSELIQVNLDYFCAHQTPMEQDYLRDLRTVMGLGFTAALVDHTMVSLYLNRVQSYVRYDDDQSQDRAGLLSRVAAEMIALGEQLFGYLGYPAYYPAYVSSLRRLLNTVPLDLAGKTEQARQLLQTILPVRFLRS